MVITKVIELYFSTEGNSGNENAYTVMKPSAKNISLNKLTTYPD
jgi:hypothetical protein